MDRLCISPEVASLVHPSHFDLLLFQLDDTLICSGRLNRFRNPDTIGKQSEDYRLSLWAEAQALTHLIPEAVLLQVRQTWPQVRLGVITSAPRIYGRTLLKACYPNIRWDCLEAFENFPAGCAMPDPAGVFRAARAAGVDDMSRIAVPAPTSRDLDNHEPKSSANRVLADGTEREQRGLLDCSAEHLKNLVIVRGKDDYAQLFARIENMPEPEM